MEVYAPNIDNVDAWEVCYEVGTDDFRVYEQSTNIWWKPVFYYDIDGYPSGFEGWKHAE